jgi:endonuclease YncB( thermonuclease family)
MKNIFSTVVLLGALVICGVVRADNDPLLRMSEGYKNVKVDRMIKSDLILLENGKYIHLIGIKVFDVPKKYNLPRDQYGFIIEDTSDPTVSVDDRAHDFAKELMENKKVRVVFDTQALDNDGYTFGYVFLADGTMANAEILRQGFAELRIQPPNLKYADQLREAYREARAEKRGVHAN